MPTENVAQNSPGGGGLEPKARGANRSTKVAGKLKVLPEQPEPVTAKVVGIPSSLKDQEGTTGDSDEGDIDDDDQDEPEDVEVS